MRYKLGMVKSCREAAMFTTIRKQGHKVLDAIVRAVRGTPVPIALSSFC